MANIPVTTSDETEVITSIKGFDADFKCRGFQFAVGQTYEHAGNVKTCKSGFHAISGHPLEVFQYYPPADLRFAEVKQSGTLARSDDDSKVASSRISVEVELHLHEIIQRAVKWVFDRAKWVDGPVATGAYDAATTSGESGAAMASGARGAATASGTNGRVRGAVGCALFLVHRAENGTIAHAWAGIAGRDGIKPMVWYFLKDDGTPSVCEGDAE